MTIILLGFIVQIGFADSVIFKSSSKGKNDQPIKLTGILTRPEGNGPFPAVVLLHGCSGLQHSKSRNELWLNRLVKWGYVVLQVDSFKPRKISAICDDAILQGRMALRRSQDAYDAKTFLAELPFVDRNRVAIMGWSHGGWAVMQAISKRIEDVDPFKAVIAFYPWCKYLVFQNAPLLILIGGLDDWTPANRCSNLLSSVSNKPPEVILKIYPEAYHGFDWEGMDQTYLSYRLLYDPIASQNAIIQVKSFLSKYLK